MNKENPLTNVMKKRVLFIVICSFIAFSFSSCATIFGGARYNAKVYVPGHPEARITVNGQYKGDGEANFKVKRRDADELSITVQEQNCEKQTTLFTSKTFRGWSFVGSLVGWTGMVGYIPLPWGIAVDAATGAWWKPDVSEKGVSKIDYDNFLYTIEYKAIPIKGPVITPSETTSDNTKVNRLRELKKLLDEGILTQDEYEKEKAKILDSD